MASARAATDAPHWLAYGERHDRLILVAALSVKLVRDLSLGLGASLVLDASGRTVVGGRLATTSEARVELELEPDAAPTTGLSYAPADWISLGPSFLFAVDHGWVQWSAYDPVFLEVSSGVVSVAPSAEADLRDGFHVRPGAEWQLPDRWALRAGYAFRTSAVPDHEDRSTHLADAEKHVVALEVGWTWGPPPRRSERPRPPPRSESPDPGGSPARRQPGRGRLRPSARAFRDAGAATCLRFRGLLGSEGRGGPRRARCHRSLRSLRTKTHGAGGCVRCSVKDLGELKSWGRSRVLCKLSQQAFTLSRRGACWRASDPLFTLGCP